MSREIRKRPGLVYPDNLGAQTIENSQTEGLTPLQSARAILEAGRALRMPAGDIAAGIGQIVREIKPVPPLRS